MSIVKSLNKKTGVTYVYESESYWDSEKKQPRNRRKLIGKLDENGEIVPTGKKPEIKPTSGDDEELIQNLSESLDIYQRELIQAKTEIRMLKEQLAKQEKEKQKILEELKNLLTRYS